jgi:hypothetical protein
MRRGWDGKVHCHALRLPRLLTVLSKRFSKLEGIIHAPDSAQEDQVHH